MKLPHLWFTKRKDELDEELRAHLRMAVADRMARGEPEAEARRNATREIGNIPLIEDLTRAMWGGVLLERVIQDVKYALRQLRRAPGFTVAVVVTLALGLGATAAMYTVVDRVLLRPLPYRNAQSLVSVREISRTGEPGWGSAFLDIAEWQARSHTLSSIAFYAGPGDNGHLDFLEQHDGSMAVADTAASANLFPTLGVSPAMGRTFLQGRNGAAREEDAHTLLVSDVVWRSAFDADLHIVGKSVTISGQRYTVIGVMPRGFAFPYGVAHPMVWTPIVLGSGDLLRQKHTTPNYATIARLAPGASPAAADAELKTIQAAAATQYTEADYREHAGSVQVERYGDSLVEEGVRKSLFALAAHPACCG